MAATKACTAVTPYGVDFIDENNAGGVFLSLFKQVANTAGAHTHEHLDEIRTGDREERYTRFTGDCARQQRLAGTGRADQQDALGNPSAELLELLRLPQKFDDLLQLFLGLFH